MSTLGDIAGTVAQVGARLAHLPGPVVTLIDEIVDRISQAPDPEDEAKRVAVELAAQASYRAEATALAAAAKHRP